jgi:hypothetical protein
MYLGKAKTLDPGLRRDDNLGAGSLNYVILAKAGIQCRSLCIR